MDIQNHKITKTMNGFLRKLKLWELTGYEAEVLVLYFLERHRELEQDMLLPYRDAFSAAPGSYLEMLLKVTNIIMEEMLDLLFTIRGVESIYCLKGRNYHED